MLFNPRQQWRKKAKFTKFSWKKVWRSDQILWSYLKPMFNNFLDSSEFERIISDFVEFPPHFFTWIGFGSYVFAVQKSFNSKVFTWFQVPADVCTHQFNYSHWKLRLSTFYQKSISKTSNSNTMEISKHLSKRLDCFVSDETLSRFLSQITS